jgi:GNAT superfamily N-acetyltransferase
VFDPDTADDIAAALEPISAEGWPPREVARLGGWRLHASDGFSGRANACWPIGSPDRPLAAAIEAVEAWYEAKSLAPIFRPADIVATAALREALADRGYAPRTPTLVMVGAPTPGDSGPVILSAEPDPSFAAVFLAGAPSPGDAAERIDSLGRIPAPRGFARIEADGATVAIGAAAVGGEWAGLFGMRTLAEHRRRGLARRILGALAAFGHEAGARRAYLQVEASNAPAIALYRGLGFETGYGYRYWDRPTG